MPVLFGTDGIRGRYGEEITTDLAYRLGRAVAAVFAPTPDAPVVVGYDTRESSPALAAAVLAGLADGGAPGVDLGVLHHAGRRGHRARARRGRRGRLGVAQPLLRQRAQGPRAGRRQARPRDRGGGGRGDGRGARARRATDRRRRRSTRPPRPSTSPTCAGTCPRDLSSLRLVIDCANGAASHVAPRALRRDRRGASPSIHDAPDGRNINDELRVDPRRRAWSTRCAPPAPTWGWPSTATPTGWSRSTRRGGVRDGDDLMVLFALDLLEGGGLRRRAGRHVDEQPRPAPSAGGARGRHRRDRRGRPQRPARARGARRGASAASSRATSSSATARRPATGCSPGCCSATSWCAAARCTYQAEAAWRRVPQALVNVARDRYDDEAVRALFAAVVDERGVGLDDVRLADPPVGHRAGGARDGRGARRATSSTSSSRACASTHVD